MLNDSLVKWITIANAGTTSTALELPETFYLAGIIKDTSLDTSVAITFTVSMDGITYYSLYNSSGVVSYTVVPATAEAFTLSKDDFYPWEYVKVVVADAQTGITTLGCVIRQY